MLIRLFLAMRGVTYFLMRALFGLLFAAHGASKLFGAFGGRQVFWGSLFGIGGFIELIGGLLIFMGLLTHWTAFVCAGQMAFAYILFHAARSPWPIQNEGELSLLYLFCFLYISARGGGRWSIDALLGIGTKYLDRVKPVRRE